MAEIPISRGQVALVDDDMFDFLNQWKWTANPVKGRIKFYAQRGETRSGSKTTICMHREIIGAPKGVWVDHANGYGLDNQRSNLRLCTPSQNFTNTLSRPNKTGYRGVFPNNSKSRPFAAWFQPGRSRRECLGYFGTAIEAAIAWDAAAKRHRGEFAVLNFPEAEAA